MICGGLATWHTLNTLSLCLVASKALLTCNFAAFNCFSSFDLAWSSQVALKSAMMLSTAFARLAGFLASDNLSFLSFLSAAGALSFPPRLVRGGTGLLLLQIKGWLGYFISDFFWEYFEAKIRP